MTSKLKCAFCNKDLILSYITDDLCCEECWESATEKVWQALLQAKQDLEIAVDALKRIKEPTAWGSLYQEQEIATDALEQITALEQESKK